MSSSILYPSMLRPNLPDRGNCKSAHFLGYPFQTATLRNSAWESNAAFLAQVIHQKQKSKDVLNDSLESALSLIALGEQHFGGLAIRITIPSLQAMKAAIFIILYAFIAIVHSQDELSVAKCGVSPQSPPLAH